MQVAKIVLLSCCSAWDPVPLCHIDRFAHAQAFMAQQCFPFCMLAYTFFLLAEVKEINTPTTLCQLPPPEEPNNYPVNPSCIFFLAVSLLNKQDVIQLPN